MKTKDTLIQIVRNFFKAFDEKDFKKIKKICIPKTQMIHHNGVTTNTEEMCKVIEDTINWWPRKRKIWDFDFFSSDNLSVLGLKNQVTFSLPKNKIIEELYRETWIFNKINKVWKPVRIHYSSITQQKHSEEVK